MNSHSRNGFFSCFCLKRFQTNGDQKKSVVYLAVGENILHFNPNLREV